MHGKIQQPVAAHRKRQPVRVVGRDVNQFEPGEGGKQDDRRPVAEPFQDISVRLVSGISTPANFTGAYHEVDPAPKIAEQALDDGQPDPEQRPHR